MKIKQRKERKAGPSWKWTFQKMLAIFLMTVLFGGMLPPSVAFAITETDQTTVESTDTTETIAESEMPAAASSGSDSSDETAADEDSEGQSQESEDLREGISAFHKDNIQTNAETYNENSSIPISGADDLIEFATNINYEISIPAQVTAGDVPVEIGIDTGSDFDLGHNGKVIVGISDGLTNGNVSLTRQGASNTITSALMVNGQPFTDVTAPIATFNNVTDGPVELGFDSPTGEIPAGTYQGKLTFSIDYSEE